MLMPVSGPIPGRTPTTVPTRHPRNAYHSTSGCSATENPSSKLSIVPIRRSIEDLCGARPPYHTGSAALEPQELQDALVEWRLQRAREEEVGRENNCDAIEPSRKRMAALGPEDQGEQQQRH